MNDFRSSFYRRVLIIFVLVLFACGMLSFMKWQVWELNLEYPGLATSYPRFDHIASFDYARRLTEQAVQTNEVEFIAQVCYAGIISGYGNIVAPACDHAVELAPDNMQYIDYRGIARMINEDFEGALIDLTIYVSWLRETDQFESHFGAERERWLADLQAGRDPLIDCRDDTYLTDFLECDGLFDRSVSQP